MLKDFIKRNYGVILVILCLFLFHVIVGCHIATKRTGFYLHNDGEEYYALAQSFAKESTFICHKPRYYEMQHDKPLPEAHRAFGLPILAGLMMKIHNSIETSAIFIALIHAMLCGVIFYLSWHMTGSRTGGWLALLLCNIHPLMVQYSFQFSSETLFTLFLLLFASAWQMKKDSALRYCLLGVFAAMAALTRPTGNMLLPSACFFLVLPAFLQNWKEKKIFHWRKEYSYALLYCVIFLLCVTPYGLFNLKHHGSFSLSGYLGGYNILFANSMENFEAYKNLQNGKKFLHHQTNAWNYAIKTVQNLPAQYKNNPAEQDRLVKLEAFNNLKQMGIQRFAGLFLIRAWHFIQPWSVPGIHSPLIFWGMTCFSLLLYGIGITGIILLIKKGAGGKLLPYAAIISGLWFAHALVHFYLRYRIPIVDPVLIIGSAMTGVVLLQNRNVFYNWIKRPKSSQNC
ncbi:MAG: glycosyltransferase family 39 protein [Lentisphaeria bacterium]|nr:glycosyltransferase family 39 protein [Lentisphaeria bacterium]